MSNVTLTQLFHTLGLQTDLKKIIAIALVKFIWFESELRGDRHNAN